MVKQIKMRLKRIDRTQRSGYLNLLIKPISLLLTLTYTPLLLSYLDTEKYGLWTTVLSIISWINYFDVGIGNGLRNVLAKDIETNDVEHAKRAVSTAYILLTIISACILVALIIMTALVNWNAVFSTSIDMRATLLITFLFICVNFILSLSNIILYALQMSEKIAIRGCFIQVLNIIGLLFISGISKGNLVYLAILFGSTTLIVNIINSVQIMNKRKFLIPKSSAFSKSMISEICGVGIQFFMIQLMCMLMFTVDDLLITHFFGAKVVTPFSMVNKVYNTGYSFLAAFLVPFWSGTTAAVARKDTEWIVSSIRKTVGVLAVFILGCVIVGIFFKPLVKLWLKRELDYQDGIIATMAVFYILYSVLAVESQFINGVGKLETQLVMYMFLGIANIPLSIFLGVQQNLGTVGIRLATTMLVFLADIVLGVNLYKIVNEFKDKAGKITLSDGKANTKGNENE